MNRTQELFYGNRLLAEAGIAPMSEAQAQRFLAESARKERLGMAIVYAGKPLALLAFVSLAVGGGVGYLLGTKRRRK